MTPRPRSGIVTLLDKSRSRSDGRNAREERLSVRVKCVCGVAGVTNHTDFLRNTFAKTNGLLCATRPSSA